MDCSEVRREVSGWADKTLVDINRIHTTDSWRVEQIKAVSNQGPRHVHAFHSYRLAVEKEMRNRGLVPHTRREEQP